MPDRIEHSDWKCLNGRHVPMSCVIIRRLLPRFVCFAVHCCYEEKLEHTDLFGDQQVVSCTSSGHARQFLQAA